MFDKAVSFLALFVFGGMLATALRPGAPTASVIGASGTAFAKDLLASQGRTTMIHYPG